MFFGKRKKYSFNNDTLTFDQVTHSIKDHLIRLLVYTILGGIIAIIAIIKRTNLILSPDTSIVHITEGLKKPLLAFYSNNEKNYAEWHPIEKQTEVVRYKEILNSISMEEVSKKLKDIKCNLLV